MSGHLLVVGGEQVAPRGVSAGVRDWYRFKRAVILDVDSESGSANVVAAHVSPPEVRPAEDPAILFKSSAIDGDRLFACTQTEILVYQLPGFALLHYLSLPFFNDLHHVRPTAAGTLLVAVSGLDMVVELTLDGRVLHEYSALPTSPWDRFSHDVDYRPIATTKPHYAHPNQVFLIGTEPWATRFEKRDAISLINPERRIDIAIERPHDGLVVGSDVYFTTVDGHVVIADTASLQVREVVDLASMHPRDELLGWTRGLHVDGDLIWVGFSRIRPTKFRENVGFVLRGFRKDLGTGIGCYDLKSHSCVTRITLEDAGLGAVFSILPAPAVVEAGTRA